MSTKIKTIQYLQISKKFRIQTWYFSPLPSELQNLETLFVCEQCLALFQEEFPLMQHIQSQNDFAHQPSLRIIPPGLEIYRDEKCAVFEVSGITERIYCENLCLIAKLFLDHKNIKYDCTPFLFYVLIEFSSRTTKNGSVLKTQNFAGYFSKELGQKVENNLSCILVMPHCQRKGFGKFMIEFSYELSKIEKKKGTPERPLSDLGFQSYVSWWAIEIIKYLLESKSISKMSI